MTRRYRDKLAIVNHYAKSLDLVESLRFGGRDPTINSTHVESQSSQARVPIAASSRSIMKSLASRFSRRQGLPLRGPMPLGQGLLRQSSTLGILSFDPPDGTVGTGTMGVPAGALTGTSVHKFKTPDATAYDKLAWYGQQTGPLMPVLHGV